MGVAMEKQDEAREVHSLSPSILPACWLVFWQPRAFSALSEPLAVALYAAFSSYGKYFLVVHVVQTGPLLTALTPDGRSVEQRGRLCFDIHHSVRGLAS
jgi:hypothetical protein